MKKLLLLILGLISCLPGALFADTITLKSGEQVEGQLIEQGNNFIRIEVDGASITYLNSEIMSIERDSSVPETQDKDVFIKSENNNSFDNQTEVYRKTIQSLAEEGNREKVFSELKNKIKLNPGFLPAYHLLGEGFVVTAAYLMPEARTIELLDIFEKGVKNNFNDAWSYFYLATLYRIVGRMYDARNAYQKTKEFASKGRDPGALGYFIKEDLKEVNEFIVDLEKEVGKVETMSRIEKIEAAKKCVDKIRGQDLGGMGKYSLYAINIAPDSPEVAMAYVGLASAFFSDEGADIAIYYYNKAIELKPDLAEAYMGLGGIKFAMGRMQNDRQQLAESEKLYDKADTLLRQQGNTELLRSLEMMRSQGQFIKDRKKNTIPQNNFGEKKSDKIEALEK